MRFATAGASVLAWLLLAASNASAFSFRMEARGPTHGLRYGDLAVVDVFFDADQPGVILASVAVLQDPGFLDYSLTYDRDASAALPIIHPAPPEAFGTTGALPGYILYDPGAGTGMAGRPATWLEPQQSPSWGTWPAPPVGQRQFNINYAENNITDTFNTAVTGSNIWIGSLAFRVTNPYLPMGSSGELQGASASDFYETLSLSMTVGSAILQVDRVVLDPATVALSAPITFTSAPIPEPATMTFVGLGLAGIALLRRRARSLTQDALRS